MKGAHSVLAYDFKQLSPHDFELLARDLIQARDSIVLETFKNGRDHGIDFRYSRGAANTIVQCKHYVGSGLAPLLRALQEELPKAKRLNPQRYILVTSVDLTPSNKSAIKKLFTPLIQSAGDIIGQADLNNLLTLYEEIHGRQYKLWLSSRMVLDRVIHGASVTQSEFDVQRVHREICRYVHSAAYPRALEMLNDNHVAIVSGAPGVGKTTLARMLLYHHLERGYEAISILTDFQTGRERYQPGKKQIFYFDDFMGATFLGERAAAFTRNEDAAILDFIEMTRASKSARLVMTTREHILQQAIATSEKLKHSRLIDSRCVLAIEDYSKWQRAEILYNHIYFSDLPAPYREELLADRFYLEVISHKKFNPRLIEWLSDFHRVRSVPAEGYRTFVRNLLANPAEIWTHAYQCQISNAGRSALLALYTRNGSCRAGIAEDAFWSLHAVRGARYGFQSDPSDWRRALSELNGSFVRPGEVIEVIDPSVLDLLNTVLRDTPQNALDMVEGATSFSQMRKIWSVAAATENLPVMQLLMNEQARVVTTIERLLRVPCEMSTSHGVSRCDDSPALRLTLMIDIACKLRATALVPTLTSSLATLLAAPETHALDLIEGVALANKFAGNDHVLGPDAPSQRQRILRKLAKLASEGCGSYELLALLGSVDVEEVSTEMFDDLAQAGRVFCSDYLDQELSDAKATSDFEGLEECLELIAMRLNVNVGADIDAVNEKRQQFEEIQERLEEGRYEQWKEDRHSAQAGDQRLEDLFDSLRRRG